MLDLAVIGAGPCGLAVGVAEKLEIGGVPFVTAAEKPSRREALAYYRKVAEYFELDVRQYHEVRRVARARDGFELTAHHPGKTEPERVVARNLIYATGYFESPNPLGVPGEELAHVSHFFVEAHPYWQQRVVVVGGGNSAVEAALELHRVGARVTLVHFLGEFDRGVKPWILPDITNRVQEGSIAGRWRSRVAEIGPRHVLIRCETDGSTETVPADFVLALTGYRADLSLLRSVGVEVDEASGVPRHTPDTMETNVRGVYIAGVVAAGLDANKIFIENGRLHGGLICAHIKSKPSRV